MPSSPPGAGLAPGGEPQCRLPTHTPHVEKRQDPECCVWLFSNTLALKEALLLADSVAAASSKPRGHSRAPRVQSTPHGTQLPWPQSSAPQGARCVLLAPRLTGGTSGFGPASHGPQVSVTGLRSASGPACWDTIAHSCGFARVLGQRPP